MDTIIIKSEKKSTSDFILDLAKRIRVKAHLLNEEEMEDLLLNRMLKEDEKKLESISEEKVYKILKKHGAAL